MADFECSCNKLLLFLFTCFSFKTWKLYRSAAVPFSYFPFIFSFQKLKQKAEQDNADELQSVNEVLESYGY